MFWHVYKLPCNTSASHLERSNWIQLIQILFTSRKSSLLGHLEQPGNLIEGALGELMQHLPGAAGAAVLVVGVDADGKPMVSAIPKASETREDRVRPYRLAVRELDQKLFKAALEATGGNIHDAAGQLGLPVSTFRYRATKLGLLKPTGDS